MFARFRRRCRSGLSTWCFLMVLGGLAGCQPTVYLMPTPLAFQGGVHDPFLDTPEAERSNRVMVLYATNRIPIGVKQDRQYTTLYTQDLRLGVARLRIGENKSWEELRSLSVAERRASTPALALEQAVEMAVVEEGTGADELSPAAREFFGKIDAALEGRWDKNLTLYIHGANSNFYRAAAQAAQYRHFTGRHSLVMLVSWPSAESLLGYATDVHNAAETAPLFGRLVDLLARHTRVEHINILAYSAGAQIVSPGLVALRARYADRDPADLRRRLRIGEVYFAAPDVNFRDFLENFASYKNMVDSVTLAINPSDTVLTVLAEGHHGVSRAGAPDVRELSDEETRWVVDATRHGGLDVLGVSAEELPGLSGGSHDFWYSHPWVSTDVLVQLLFRARPVERGLAEIEGTHGSSIWYFPEDYPVRVDAAIRRLDSTSDGTSTGAGPGTERSPRGAGR